MWEAGVAAVSTAIFTLSLHMWSNEVGTAPFSSLEMWVLFAGRGAQDEDARKPCNPNQDSLLTLRTPRPSTKYAGLHAYLDFCILKDIPPTVAIAIVTGWGAIHCGIPLSQIHGSHIRYLLKRGGASTSERWKRMWKMWRVLESHLSSVKNGKGQKEKVWRVS